MVEKTSDGIIKKCRACLKEVEAKAKKCHHCGTDLRNWFSRHKIITVILAFILLSMFSAALNDSKTARESVQEKVPYRIVERWDIPNGGEGQAIVIASDNVNETDMRLLGDILKGDNKNNRNSFVFVFDDEGAAKLRSEGMSDSLSAEDQNFFDKHYVGQYAKNGNTEFHQFTIFLNGVLGDKITVEY